MKTFAGRRRRNFALLAAAALLVLAAYALLAVSLRSADLYTGWLLAAMIVLLACYNMYKKVPFLPLGASAAWLQLHIYVGLLTILVFALHVTPRWPFGLLGWLLSALYVGVAGSGILGLIMSRTFPAVLRTRGDEVIFERIPVIRLRLREQAEQLILANAAQTHSSFLADYYVERLAPFFAGPRHFWRHVLRVSGDRHSLLTELDAQRRFLNADEQKTLEALRLLVKAKDDLDCQHALQAMLKYWLFAHIPLTYSLLVFSAFHVIVIYAYSGVSR